MLFLNLFDGIRGAGGMQWIGNGCGLQMNGFSTHFDQDESIFEDVYDLGHFAIVFDGLTLFPEGPRTLRDRPEGAGTVWECVMVL